MTTVGLVGAGAMGSALGAGWIDGGAEVRTCLAGRSDRTRELAAAAGLADVSTLEDVVRCDLVVSVVPPGATAQAARTIAEAARRAGATPLVADLNAVSPTTLDEVARILATAGLTLVDGSISGGPPATGERTRVYLSGPDAGRVVAVPNPRVDAVVLDGGIGAASALKMCTASVYKGSKAIVMQAMLAARHHGVLAPFLDDTARQWPDEVPRWHTDLALAASKSARYVAEMEQIAATQQAAGLSAELFHGVAAAFARAARTPAAARPPERVDPSASVVAVLAELAVAGPAEPAEPAEAGTETPAAVLFDFSGTLFHIESPEQALLGALGPRHLHLAPELRRFGAINGSGTPEELPENFADVWERRDLSAEAHHAAYAGLSVHAGLTAEEADTVYARGIGPESWHPFPDTIAVLRSLHERGVPVAMISNIGWDPRPVLARYGVDRDIDVLVLSYERGVVKPDPRIFRLACAELGVAPERALMIGDNRQADGAATAVGARFVEVAADPGTRRPDELTRAVAGLLPGAAR